MDKFSPIGEVEFRYFGSISDIILVKLTHRIKLLKNYLVQPRGNLIILINIPKPNFRNSWFNNFSE
jgi:hypothetical protein